MKVETGNKIADPDGAVAVNTPPIDPQQTLCDTLQGSASSDDKRAARTVVSGMERPWEQLPSRLKSAIRIDAVAVLNGSGGVDEMIAAGYGQRTSEFILRDLGKRG